MEEENVDVQKIGQIFVIRYYTQMHKDPSQLHRFYLEHSVFTRGGPENGTEKPVVGQKAIDEKILSLGLQQVHTKIRQVDSHETVSNEIGPAIVVQVTGELSNAGCPMRPFVQTFVLACESPKKYYVRNDIFRYQFYDEDLVSEPDATETGGGSTQTGDLNLTEEEEEEIQRTSIKQDVTLTQESKVPPQDDEVVSEHSGKGVSPAPPTPLENVLTSGSSWGNSGDHYDGSTEVVVVQSNGLPEDEPSVESPTFPVIETSEMIPSPTVPPTTSGVSHVSNSLDENEVVMKAPVDTTWAAKLKSAKNQSGSSSVQGVANNSGSTSGSGNKSYSQPQPRSSNNLIGSSQPLPQREPKQSSASSRKPPSTSSDLANKTPFESSKNKSSLPSSNLGVGGGGQSSSLPSLSRTTPDSHQIFVGNLPNGVNEDELKEVFKKYGNVIEVRINPKNFGFIVFDGEDAVHAVMSTRSEKPVMLHDRRLNIEEKRPSYSKSFQSGSGNFSGGNSRMFSANKMPRGGMATGSKAPPRR